MKNMWMWLEIYFGLAAVGDPIVKAIEPGYDMTYWPHCVILMIVFDILRRRKNKKDEEKIFEANRHKYVVGGIGLK